jgi:hypothetical protein
VKPTANLSPAKAGSDSELDCDPGVTPARLPQAILFHAFSVKRTGDSRAYTSSMSDGDSLKASLALRVLPGNIQHIGADFTGDHLEPFQLIPIVVGNPSVD